MQIKREKSLKWTAIFLLIIFPKKEVEKYIIYII